MAEWNPRANELFAHAIQLTTENERQTYLDQACGNDADLKQAVVALLKAHEQAGSFLNAPHPAVLENTPGLGATIELPPPMLPGTVIGPYKLLQQIGEGGMGVVYMAEQTEPVHRKVALKIIKPGMDSRQVIARFEAERQALAMMDHVNIARVIDGGTISSPLSPPGRGIGDEGEPGGISPGSCSGRPYFVMELIHGIPITKYCDDNHLTPRERLELFVPVCQAIQHAHQKGIIHRDIKPSNVIVTLYDGKPVPKVIDFGVAKAIDQKLTDRTMFTDFGTMVGTLEYMSPEQAEVSNLSVDTRSDIYSLGVLLYELLTGSTPLTRKQLKQAANLEILRLIKEEEPQKPSTRLSDSGDALASISAQRNMEPAKLSKLVRGELDWIVMKTLEKDRNRRYETASAFADDILHYLRYEPVKACPPSAIYRFRKFARRYKAAIITTGIVAVALLISTADSLYQMFEAKMARKLADERLVNETEARNLALAAVDRMLTRVGDESVRGIPQMEQVRLKLLQDAVAFYQELLAKRQDDTEIRCEVAIASFRLGEMYMELGHPSQARVLYKETERILDELLRQSPDNLRYRVELARFYNRLSWQANIPESVSKRYQTRSIELVKPIVDSHPANFEIRNERLRTTLADSYRIYSAFRIKSDNLNEIEEEIREAIALCKDDPGHGQYVLAHCYRTLATVEANRNHKAKELEYSKMAVSINEEIMAKGSTSTVYRWELCNGLQGYGYCLFKAGQFPEAEIYLRRTLHLREKMAKDFPSSQLLSGLLVIARLQLAELFSERREYDKAVAEFNRAEETPGGGGAIPWEDNIKVAASGTTGFGSPLAWYQYKPRAIAYFHLENYEKALADLVMAEEMNPEDTSILTWIPPVDVAKCPDEKFRNGILALADKAIGRNGGKNSNAIIESSLLYATLGQLEKADQLFTKAMEVRLSGTVKDHPNALLSMNNLGVMYWNAGRLDRSIPIFDELFKLYKSKLGPDHPETLREMTNLGINFRDANRLQEAATLLVEALERIRVTHKDDPSKQVWVLINLAETYERSFEFNRAETLFREGLTLARKLKGETSPPHANVLAFLGLHLLKQKKYEEAEPILRECLTIRTAIEAADWKTDNAKSLLGGSLLGQKKYAEAEPLLIEGYEGMKLREDKITLPGKIRLPEALERLVQLYEAINQPENACDYAEKLKQAKLQQK